MNLTEAKEGEEYIIKEILTDDEELTSFLFSLGCYSFFAADTIYGSKNKSISAFDFIFACMLIKNASKYKTRPIPISNSLFLVSLVIPFSLFRQLFPVRQLPLVRRLSPVCRLSLPAGFSFITLVYVPFPD